MKTIYPGVYIRTHKTRKSLQIDFTYNGKRHRPSLHIEPTKRNQKSAFRLLCKIQSEILEGIFDPTQHFNGKKILNFIKFTKPPLIRELVLKWMQEKSKLKSTKFRLADHKRHLASLFDHLPCTELTVSMVQDAIDNLEQSKNTKKNTFRALSGAMNIAIRNDLVSSNPLSRVQYNGSVANKTDPFSYNEMKKIIDYKDPFWSCLYKVAFLLVSQMRSSGGFYGTT